jgi:hypothetical protein
MQDAGADMMEIHLPERWAVLEQALRQMHAEEAFQNQGRFVDEDSPTETEAPRHMR